MAVVLAIETSCDETAVAVLRGRAGEAAEVLASVVHSQVPLHREYGGVVPEVASRDHSARLRGLVERALAEAGCESRGIDVFAATSGPGLASSLLVGSTVAKAMACAAGRPYVAVNHLEGHLLSPFLDQSRVPPHLALIVSGGHTLLLDVEGAGLYRRLGTTRDDAAGEAFDKVAKLLGLPYPGGPEIEREALGGDDRAYAFPRPMLYESHHDFSFSGLKTAVLYALEKEADRSRLCDIAASFQRAVVDVLVGKTLRAARACGRQVVAVSGGVGLNRALLDSFGGACAAEGMRFVSAPARFCADNAGMIGFAALLRHHAGLHDSLDTDIDPNLPLA
jgi:N6-L-threonylcarbamoyladenine synthase